LTLNADEIMIFVNTVLETVQYFFRNDS